jgi:outer membrane protein OmpA-like peptidoglycan-associated protein
MSCTLRRALGVLALALATGIAAAPLAQAETAPAVVPPEVTGQIEWGVWIDGDGCMHWWADGGQEGYMVPRRNPRTGKPVCLKRNTCLVENTDTLFATDSASLTAAGRKRLQDFFLNGGAFGYAIYGHTDSRGSAAHNMALSQRRAQAVAQVAGSVGAPVERVAGLGEGHPVASNRTAAGMAKNRRVEIVCYRW